MAYYAYKTVRDQLPEWITDGIEDYEGDGNYDGDQWYAAEAYIDFLENRLITANIGISNPSAAEIQRAKSI